MKNKIYFLFYAIDLQDLDLKHPKIENERKKDVSPYGALLQWIKEQNFPLKLNNGEFSEF